MKVSASSANNAVKILLIDEKGQALSCAELSSAFELLEHEG